MGFPATREEMIAQGYQKLGEKKCAEKNCGALIEMWRTPANKAIPMNATGEFVTHFATCPARLRFMRAKKQKGSKARVPNTGDLF
jgi:hypothetical protein